MVSWKRSQRGGRACYKQQSCAAEDKAQSLVHWQYLMGAFSLSEGGTCPKRGTPRGSVSCCHHGAHPCRAVGAIHVFAEPVTVRVNLRLRTKTRIFLLKRYSLKNPSEKFRYFSSSRSLKTEKFQTAIVIHFAVVVPAARHNFDGGYTTQICGKPR